MLGDGQAAHRSARAGAVGHVEEVVQRLIGNESRGVMEHGKLLLRLG